MNVLKSNQRTNVITLLERKTQRPRDQSDEQRAHQHATWHWADERQPAPGTVVDFWLPLIEHGIWGDQQFQHQQRQPHRRDRGFAKYTTSSPLPMVAVSLPKGASTAGTGFSLELPEIIKSKVTNTEQVQVQPTDGSPLPASVHGMCTAQVRRGGPCVLKPQRCPTAPSQCRSC